MNDKKKNLEQMLEDVAFNDAVDRGHQDLLEKKLLLNFHSVRSRQNSRWRIVINRNLSKLAAAAIIVIALFFGYEV